MCGVKANLISLVYAFIFWSRVCTNSWLLSVKYLFCSVDSAVDGLITSWIWHTHKEIGDAWGIVSCYMALATILWAKARVESFQPGPKPLQSAAVTILQEIMVNVPNNVAQLTILLIGNFKKSDVSLLLKQYFEHWCDPPAPPHPWWLYCSHRLQTAQLCVQIDALCVACVTHNRSMKPE